MWIYSNLFGRSLLKPPPDKKGVDRSESAKKTKMVVNLKTSPFFSFFIDLKSNRPIFFDNTPQVASTFMDQYQQDESQNTEENEIAKQKKIHDMKEATSCNLIELLDSDDFIEFEEMPIGNSNL